MVKGLGCGVWGSVHFVWLTARGPKASGPKAVIVHGADWVALGRRACVEQTGLASGRWALRVTDGRCILTDGFAIEYTGTTSDGRTFSKRKEK